MSWNSSRAEKRGKQRRRRRGHTEGFLASDWLPDFISVEKGRWLGVVCLQRESPRERPSRQSARRSLRPPRVLDCRIPIVLELEIAVPSHPLTKLLQTFHSANSTVGFGQVVFQSPDVPLSTLSWNPRLSTWPISAGNHSMGLHNHIGIASVLTLRVADETPLASAQTQSTEHEGTSRPKDGDLSHGIQSPMALPPGTLPSAAMARGHMPKRRAHDGAPPPSSWTPPLMAKTWTRPNEAGLGSQERWQIAVQ